MKKVLLTLALAIATTGVFAQTLSNASDREVGTTTKSGQKILPQAGDFAIGIDATSFLDYAGNSFNGNLGNSAPAFSFGGNDATKGIFEQPTIYAKYFLTDATALRVKLHLGFDSKTFKNKVFDDNNKADEENEVEDKYKLSESGLGLRVGYEIRRGYGRLQGSFGPEVGLGFSSRGSRTYEWGNSLNPTDFPGGATSTNFGDDGTVIGDVVKTDRLLSVSPGSTFTALLGGFAGVEYFVAPKLSIGGEVGLNFQFSSTGGAKAKNELINTKNEVEKNEAETSGNSTFNFATKYTGAINVTFHF